MTNKNTNKTQSEKFEITCPKCGGTEVYINVQPGSWANGERTEVTIECENFECNHENQVY